MTPRDWNKMKKLLEDVAGEKTAQEILKRIEEVKEITPATYESVASDEVLKTVISSEVSTTDSSYVDLSGTALISGFSGTVRFVVSIKTGGDNGYNNACTVDIRKNGTSVGTLVSSTNTTSYETKTLDVAVSDGDYFTFYFKKGNMMGSAVYINLLTVCGTVSNVPFGYKVA